MSKYTNRIIDVWEDNFTDELRRIADLVDEYTYIAMVM